MILYNFNLAISQLISLDTHTPRCLSHKGDGNARRQHLFPDCNLSVSLWNTRYGPFHQRRLIGKGKTLSQHKRGTFQKYLVSGYERSSSLVLVSGGRRRRGSPGSDSGDSQGRDHTSLQLANARDQPRVQLSLQISS